MNNLEQLDLFEKNPLYKFRMKDFKPIYGIDNYKSRNRGNPDNKIFRGLDLLVFYNLSVVMAVPSLIGLRALVYLSDYLVK